jgi:DNA-damage-inducible protein D
MTNENKKFEAIKHTDEMGCEFWLARELQEVLDYKKWENFHKVIKTAQIACNISQHEVIDHFAEVKKLVVMPKGGKSNSVLLTSGKPKTKQVQDYKLSRYACYLIVMNGDPRKQVIANGQTYFAIKTRQQEFNELYSQLSEDDKRLFLRGDIKQKNMLLAECAKKAGIITPIEYAVFQDYGYKGLYNGETARDIADRKGIDAEKESILDYMGSLELATNLFRITATEDSLRRRKITDRQEAQTTHYNIGKSVRKTLAEIGANMPEKMPLPDKSIKQIEKEKRKQIK